MIGKKVIVYDRYLFAVPVKGTITHISDHDGAYAINFSGDNPGGSNVTKHNGAYFFTEQCKMIETEKPKEIMNLSKSVETLNEYMEQGKHMPAVWAQCLASLFQEFAEELLKEVNREKKNG